MIVVIKTEKSQGLRKTIIVQYYHGLYQQENKISLK